MRELQNLRKYTCQEILLNRETLRLKRKRKGREFVEKQRNKFLVSRITVRGLDDVIPEKKTAFLQWIRI
ncbi:hypothetical protein Y1Q_0005948 [Alligator mississippiensis]|uniref:Uncharacterized protein n=1 Tax=Alligator mississippiensis TaxID=8496 RepID=A0A151MYV7_ALLMI|nr:hypothetical protein Y1Q_0005948 [Alligator mississippiensis]